MASQPLQPGHEIHCPHCRRWHPVAQKYAEGTHYTTQMLMWDCRGGSYYAGQIGTPSRLPTIVIDRIERPNARLIRPQQ